MTVIFAIDAIPKVTKVSEWSKGKAGYRARKTETNQNPCLSSTVSDPFAMEMHVCLAQDSGELNEEIHRD
jgi:hypothetical protein